MTAVLDGPPDLDQPRPLKAAQSPGDTAFTNIVRSVGVFVLVLTGSIGIFLGYQVIPTVKRYGTSFFTETQWSPNTDVIGVVSVVVASIEVAVIALAVGFPLALLTALWISEYCPRWLKAYAVSAMDLMAAIPSIIYGLWGYFALMPHAAAIARWLQQHFGFLPVFHVSADANTASYHNSFHTWEQSAFIAGLCVSLMIIPTACSVMRQVFSQAPIGEREAAYALGSTRLGMIRAVVLPFGRGGIIGGTMLGLGRALGETIAVLIIVEPHFEVRGTIIEIGTQTISGLIAGGFGEASPSQLTALFAAGFVLFAMTIVINTIAAVFVNRSRSGAGADV